MTTYQPDSLEQNPRILKGIVQKFAGELALNCYVIRGGELQVGDRVELVADCTALAEASGDQPHRSERT